MALSVQLGFGCMACRDMILGAWVWAYSFRRMVLDVWLWTYGLALGVWFGSGHMALGV